MKDAAVHLVWVLTHFLRTLWTDQKQNQLVDTLSYEVSTLQAEIHRTQNILKGYGNLLERCETQHRVQWWGNTAFLLTAVLLLVCLVVVRLCRPQRVVLPVIADTGGSSDSDEPGPNCSQVRSSSLGPQRPSTFGRAKQR